MGRDLINWLHNMRPIFAGFIASLGEGALSPADVGKRIIDQSCIKVKYLFELYVPINEDNCSRISIFIMDTIL